ncbi:hypothetical protein BGZ97_003755 [Linnemannia gamsii]|uniref:Uncharacterized protein n=1 Tax=Linnemannia gamsii TaxID=64522 RepID=A0A9P6RFI5_9FUNG|nr:hypothetical protein BGZ97_003755 [Linnemannia gamsii]
MPALKVFQYRQISTLLSDVEPLGGSHSEIIRKAVDNILKLGLIVKTCDHHIISTNTLFGGIDVHAFLSTEAYRTALGINAPDVATVSAVGVLRGMCRYIAQLIPEENPTVNSQMIIDAHNLFMTNFNVFTAEVENEKIQQEIKLDAFKSDYVNKKQLEITIRNTYITLAGMIVTALLTVANIIVNVVTHKK